MDKRIIKTKKSIYDALLILMKDKSFEEIKISDICKTALINRSTFYSHFDDKYELLDSLINDLRNELLEDLNKNNNFNSEKEYYMEIINLFLNHIDNNIDIYSPILKNNNNGIVMNMLYNTIINFIEICIKKQNIKTKVPVEVITKFYVTGIVDICLDYIKYPKKYSKDKLINYFNILIPDDLYLK